ncbi:MAG: hypothetical protein ACREAE_00110 [Nitrosopumilaceae archaeon]
MNIHAPSLGMGAAIAAVSILGAFFVLGLDTSENDNPIAKIKLSDTSEKQAKESDNKIGSSLFLAEATSLLGSKMLR